MLIEFRGVRRSGRDYVIKLGRVLNIKRWRLCVVGNEDPVMRSFVWPFRQQPLEPDGFYVVA
jgi:hypothetical protein